MTGSATPVRAIWLGRQRELGELEAGLVELATGRGGLYLVVGEPGIGKTRLCDELTRSATARGIAVHWGRAWEAGGAPSYWPFIQIVRSTSRGVDPATLAATISPELASLVPELRPGAVAPQHEPFEIFDAVTRYLHGVAERAPLLLVLDDLHAADPSTIQMLHFLVRDLRPRPLMIVGTYREAEARLVLEIGRSLAHVAREAVVLPLRRLDRREVGEFVALATGESGSERADAVYQRTEGNPLFLRELLQLRDASLRPPDGIREVVRARLALLAPPVRALLEVAAVLGRELALDVLAAVAGMTDADASALLAPAADAGVIEPLDGKRWRFTHVMLREGLYGDLVDERRGPLHRAVATELHQRSGDATEVAHHMLRAIPAVSVADAAEATLRAAERAIGVLAFEDAQAMLERVVVLLEREPDQERWLFEALLVLGIARIRALDSAAGRDACWRAAELARRLGDGERFARAVLGSACEVDPGTRDERLIALLQEALAMLPPGDSPLRARCMSSLAAERQPEPDTEGPVELMRAAIAMARRTGDAEALRLTLGNAGLAMMAIADPEERLALDQECLRLTTAAGDRVTAMRVHLMIALDLIELGDLAGMEAQIHAYRELIGRRFSRRHQLICHSFECWATLWRGQFDDTLHHTGEFESIASADANARDSIGGLVFPLGLRRALEDYEGLPALEASLRSRIGAIFGELGSCIAEMAICQLHASAGDRQRAARQLAAVRAHPAFVSIREAGWLALLVDAVHLLDDRELAAYLYPILLPRAHRFFSLGPLGTYAEPPYGRQLGLLAHTLGRYDDAVTHLTDAEQRTTRAGMLPYVQRLRDELARAVAARDRVAPPAPVSPGGVDVALRLEGEYWTITSGTAALRLRDSRGLQVLAQLIAIPGEELHVLQLVGTGDGERDGGDSGTALDASAVQSYRRRLLDLREVLEDAEQCNDVGRAERASAEIDVLTDELARAVGLGGRERRVGSAAERARTTIQKRLRDAIRRIEDGLPELGRHLDQSIRTGAFCGYFPDRRPRKSR